MHAIYSYKLSTLFQPLFHSMSVDKVDVFNTFLNYLFAPIVCIFRKRVYICNVNHKKRGRDTRTK